MLKGDGGIKIIFFSFKRFPVRAHKSKETRDERPNSEDYYEQISALSSACKNLCQLVCVVLSTAKNQLNMLHAVTFKFQFM